MIRARLADLKGRPFKVTNCDLEWYEKKEGVRLDDQPGCGKPMNTTVPSAERLASLVYLVRGE